MTDDLAVVNDERINCALVDVLSRLRVPEDTCVLAVNNSLLQRKRHTRLSPFFEELPEGLS